MKVYMVEGHFDWEVPAQLGVYDSFDKAVQAMTDFLDSCVDRPDRVDLMNGDVALVFHEPYDRISITEYPSNTPLRETYYQWWNLHIAEPTNYSYTTEFKKNGGHFPKNLVESWLERGETPNG